MLSRSSGLALLQRGVTALFFVSLVGASCGQKALGLLPGVVNEPGNLTLRREILRFGTGRLCEEMQKRSVPLRVRQDDPAMGRFFATSCTAADGSDGQVGVRFAGFGYAWTNLTSRLTFEASGTVLYDADFQMSGSTMYIYFRAKQTLDPQFSTKVVERPATSILTGLPFGSGGAAVGDSVGSQILKSEIGKGFTVVRDANGSVEFGIGIIERGQHAAFAPYRVTGDGKVTLANDRSELHADQRDFVGPLEVSDGARLIVNVALDGAPQVRVLLFPRGPGEVWLQQYSRVLALSQPQTPPLFDAVVTAGTVFKRSLSPPAGLYYLVIDNAKGAARDNHAALVSYGVALDP